MVKDKFSEQISACYRTIQQKQTIRAWWILAGIRFPTVVVNESN
jgi:hypothetical protein